ncbi:MAG: LytTR family transcriptional regulator DNA-binding domain-containing protein [Defluviitaleaceae bacterium]|nr:LytTR family transcriptional regulator DNA-binding domain-containing protein [Defluviitaleaceae bacterium]
MIVKLVQDSSVEESEILIRYAVMSKDIERITAMLRSANTRIKCSHEGSDKFVNASDIYYFESVDKMTFVYCEKDVYRTDYRLYQIIEEFAHLGFIQVSKSCVLNINVLESITPLLNSRMEATLTNSERIYVTRKYLENLKKALQEGI